MIFNYIIKSEIGVEVNSNGELFTKIEKSSITSPQDALNIYEEHLARKFFPYILKRDGRNWKTITAEELQKDIEKNKKPKGIKKAYQINAKKVGWLNI